MSPTPDIPPIEIPNELDPQQGLEAIFTIGIEVVVLAVAALGSFVIVAYLLTKAAKQTPQAMVTITLGMLTILALVGYLVTREEIAANLVATGIGAFAGALTALFKNGDNQPPGDNMNSQESDPQGDQT